jgi:hypothetical protein
MWNAPDRVLHQRGTLLPEPYAALECDTADVPIFWGMTPRIQLESMQHAPMG